MADEMNNKYKLLVTDIDGTIANKQGEISDTDLKALRDINQAGVLISLCTGRAAGDCKNILDRLSIEGFHIFFEGALVTNSKLTKDVYIQALQKKLLDQVRTIALFNEITLELFSRTGFFVSRESPLADIHGQLMDLKPTITDLNTLCEQENIVLGCIVIPSSEETRIMALFRTLENSLRFVSTSNPARPDIRLINITAKDVNKGTALAALISYLGLKQENVVAIGDGLNDISLLSNAGLAIAMGNSPAKLKNIANYITADVEHNGVAQAIEYYLR